MCMYFEYLDQLGMTDAFIDESANFQDLLELREEYDYLKITDFIHKAGIEINEEGAEAYAATGKYQIQQFTFLYS